MKAKSFNKIQAVGRDPTMGMLAFRTGAHTTRKQKFENRNSKLGKRLLRDQLKGE